MRPPARHLLSPALVAAPLLALVAACATPPPS